MFRWLLRWLLKCIRSHEENRKPTFTVEPLYGDSLWPWFRCFVWIWLCLLFSSGVLLWFEAMTASVLTHSYAYGLSRFWVFYIPVFGFFLRKFYTEYTDDGTWTPGTSYVMYIRNSYRDLL